MCIRDSDRTSKRSVYCHVRCDTCGDRNQSEPEDCVADTAQRTHSGNTHGTNSFDVSLLLFQREDDAHNEGNEEGVSIEELQVMLHGELQVFLVIAVDLFQTCLLYTSRIPSQASPHDLAEPGEDFLSLCSLAWL